MPKPLVKFTVDCQVYKDNHLRYSYKLIFFVASPLDGIETISNLRKSLNNNDLGLKVVYSNASYEPAAASPIKTKIMISNYELNLESF